MISTSIIVVIFVLYFDKVWYVEFDLYFVYILFFNLEVR